MVACLILYHPQITSLTKSKMLRFYFHDKEFEITVENNNTACIYFFSIERKRIYQAALLFEHEGLNTGYGFGESKSTAHRKAWNVLFKNALEEGRAGEFNIKECNGGYTFTAL